MAGWHLTSATPVDVDALMTIENRCFTLPWGRLSFESEFTALGSGNIASRTTEPFTVGEIIGYLFYRFIVDEIHILRMAVSPDWRRQGIGACILAECLEKGVHRGSTSAVLEVRPSNAAALALYRKFGFHLLATRPRYYSDSGEDAHILKLELKEARL